jgi:hypothetical protein
MELVTALGRKNRLKRRDEWRQILHNNLPQDVHIYCIVPVDEPIAEADDLGPWDLGITGTLFIGHAPGCFTDNLQQSSQSELEDPIPIQISPGFALR